MSQNDPVSVPARRLWPQPSCRTYCSPIGRGQTGPAQYLIHQRTTPLGPITVFGIPQTAERRLHRRPKRPSGRNTPTRTVPPIPSTRRLSAYLWFALLLKHIFSINCPACAASRKGDVANSSRLPSYQTFFYETISSLVFTDASTNPHVLRPAGLRSVRCVFGGADALLETVARRTVGPVPVPVQVEAAEQGNKGQSLQSPVVGGSVGRSIIRVNVPVRIRVRVRVLSRFGRNRVTRSLRRACIFRIL
jgi:hypothetical protein